MKYIVYKTTNLASKIDGIYKIYIGVHQIKDIIDDGYLGCGVYKDQPSTYNKPKTPFQYAVKKYSPINFVRETLFVYDNKEEAYNKEKEIVNIDFIKLPYTYNICLGGNGNNLGKSIYQFDIYGNLKKVWNYSSELYEYYGCDNKIFYYAINSFHILFDSIWSFNNCVDHTLYTQEDYTRKKIVYLYDINGDFVHKFDSEKDCASFLNISLKTVSKALYNHNFIKRQYYVSFNMLDDIPIYQKNDYIHTLFYVYKDYEYIGSFYGKEVMNVINMNTWRSIYDVLRYNHGWYNNYYISTKYKNKIQEKCSNNHKNIVIDVYDLNSNYIETIYNKTSLIKKYHIHWSKIKNIQYGDRIVDGLLLKFHNNEANDIV